MSVTSNPKITMQLLTALQLSGVNPFRFLIVGQIGTDGTAVEKTAYTDIESKTDAQIEALFGTESDLTNRIKIARSICNQRYSIWVIGMTPDATGAAAKISIAITGTATTEAGTVTLEVISSYHYTTTVTLASGTTKADAATAIKVAIDALDGLPATAGTITDGAFDLTANEKGLIGNKYTIKISNMPAGLTITDGQFSGGTKYPVNIADTFDNVGETRFHIIDYPWDTQSSIVSDFLESRLIIDNLVLEGTAFIGIDDTETNLSDLVNGTTPLNSPNLLFMGNRQASSTSKIITPAHWRTTEIAAIIGLRRTEGAPISEYVLATAENDLYGGVHTCSLPYFNTPLAKTYIAKPEDLFTGTEQDNLKNDGFTIVGVNISRTSMIMGSMVTTYKTNALGQNDISLKYLNFKDTVYACLEIFFNTLKTDNAQSRLTEVN